MAKKNNIRLLKPNEIECRVGMANEKGISLLLYKDARVDMKILDEAYGANNWKREHLMIGNNLYCIVSVWDEEKRQWISKMDVGSKSNTEQEKGEASDSFKRACVSIGVNEKASEIHNNCSGKHIGFLVVCKLNGWDMLTYDEPNHPLQVAVKNRINSMCEVTENYPMTTDGCGVPILSMPLYNMLIGYINLLKYDKIINAIKNNPYIFGGENRLDTEIIQKSDNLIAKVGAGGLCVVLNLEKKNAFVVKINDCSMEARRFAVLDYINKLGWANISFDRSIKTIQGKIVGEIVVRM